MGTTPFPRVLLLGGAPMSGKSTVARILGERERSLRLNQNVLASAGEHDLATLHVTPTQTPTDVADRIESLGSRSTSG